MLELPALRDQPCDRAQATALAPNCDVRAMWAALKCLRGHALNGVAREALASLCGMLRALGRMLGSMQSAYAAARALMRSHA